MGKISNIEIKKLENLYKLNKLTELEKETQKLLVVESNNLILLNILGVVFLKKKLFQKAEKIFIKILNMNSKEANALKNLGEAYRKMGKLGYAIEYYELYLKINSNDNEVINNLASSYLKNKKYRLAVNYYKILSEKNPQNQEYLTSLAFALIASLDIEEGVQILEKILDKNIKNERAYNGYISNQNYNPKKNINKIQEYIKKFNKLNKERKLKIDNFTFKKKPKKINLGFISPDFRLHPVGYAIKNLIKYLKPYNFNLFAYYNFYIEDDLTKKFKKDFDYFYNITNLNDEQIINKIRSHGIHILVDLAGHTANNNLSIFYYKPAPIQISWLGSLTTTGLKEMDFKIGDHYIFSKSMEKNYTEKFLKLPNIWSDFVVERANNLRTISNDKNYDQIILGSFVTLRKVNDSVIKLWSKVLNQFQNTKLYFKATELNDIDIEKKIKEKFLNNGINSDRLILEKSSDYKSYLEAYSKVHITLDTFPFNGVTTSFESIWMGVPIFCLEGDSALARCTYSINKNLKMDNWIAKNENEYIKKLEKILSDKKELMLTKKNLRKKAIKNNFFNSKLFTKNFADELNKVWKDFISV